MESILLRFLKKYPDWLSESDLMLGFGEMHRDLLALEEDEYEKRAFEYFDFIAWVEGKIHRVSFETSVQKKKKQ